MQVVDINSEVYFLKRDYTPLFKYEVCLFMKKLKVATMECNNMEGIHGKVKRDFLFIMLSKMQRCIKSKKLSKQKSHIALHLDQSFLWILLSTGFVLTSKVRFHYAVKGCSS